MNVAGPIAKAAAVAASAFLTPVEAKIPAAPANTVTCNSPVGPRDSARSLLRRFGKQARIERVAHSEDEPGRVLVLYPLDPSRRLVVTYFDNALRDPAQIVAAGRQSGWLFDGLKMGDSIERVVEANGKHFDLWGFDWEQGGDIQNWGEGGALASHEAQCALSVKFGPSVTGELPGGMTGQVTLRSDQPQVRALRLEVVEMSMNLPGEP